MSIARTGEHSRLYPALATVLLFTLFVLPLYPKVGLIALPDTYIPVRADDLLIGVLGLVWVASLIFTRRQPALPRIVGGAAVLWLTVTLVALLIGAFVLESIGFFTGLAFWAKPIEYLLLGWICYDLVLKKIVSVRAVVTAVFAASAIVIGYGVAEHFGLAPRMPGQGTVRGVPISTIGDVHELASYLGIIGLVLVAVWHRTHSTIVRVTSLLGLGLLLAVIFYTGVRSEYLALAACLVALVVWRPARLPAIFAIAVMAVLFATPLAQSALFGNQPTVVEGDSSGDVTDRFLGSSLSASLNERFNVKWRSYIERTMRSPIIGLGPSAATEAADGYYMRSFVESGILGLLSFVVLIGAVFLSIWRAARHGTGLGRALAVGMVASTVFVALVSVLIDTWVASRVMELYWPLIGTTLAAWALQTATNESPIKVSEPMTATSAIGV